MPCCGPGPKVGRSIRDGIYNFRSTECHILRESGLHEETISRLLLKAQRKHSTYGYIPDGTHRIIPYVEEGDQFQNIWTNRKYVIEKKIGQGNSGLVYEVRNKVVATNKYARNSDGFDSQVNRIKCQNKALKIIRLDVNGVISSGLVDGFLREIATHEHLQRYDPKNEAKILRFNEVLVGGPGRSFFGAISPIGYSSLSSLIKPYKRLSVSSILWLLHSLLGPLIVLHNIGLTHSDLKAGNIMFNREVEVKVVTNGQGNTERTEMTNTEDWICRRQIYLRERKIKPNPPGIRIRSTTSSRRENGHMPEQNTEDTPLAAPIEGDHNPLQHREAAKREEWKILHIMHWKQIDIRIVDMGASANVRRSPRQPVCCAHHIRSPEDVLKLPNVENRDMWALGLLLFELYTGYKWFPFVKGRFNVVDGWKAFLRNHDLSLLQEFCSTPQYQSFASRSQPVENETVDAIENHFASDQESQTLLRIILRCLTVDPEERPTPYQLYEQFFSSPYPARAPVSSFETLTTNQG